jgi:hypothetical protein
MNKEVFLGNAESISRRYFSRNIVAAAAIALIHDDVATAEKIMPTSAVNLGPKPEGLSVADWEEVHTKYSNLLRVYGNRLSLDEKHSLVNVLATNQHMLVSIRSFEVQNGDPSACSLRVYGPKEPPNAGRI